MKKRFLLRLLPLCIFCFLFTFKSLFSQPANDNCSGAISLTPQPFGSACSPGTQVNMTLATLSNTDCNTVHGSPYDSEYNDVWFSFVAGATNAGIQFENVLPHVFDFPSRSISVVLYTDCNGNGISNCKNGILRTNEEVNGKYLFVTTNLTIGTTYYLKASFFRSRPIFNICILNMPPITNDECSGAIALPTPQPYSAGCVSSVSGHTFGATRSNSNCDFNSNDDDIWFSFVATATTQHVQLLNILMLDSEDNFDMDIGLYDNCSSSPLTCLYPLSKTNGLIEAIFGCLTIGSTYYLRINTSSTFGRAKFDICIKNPPPPPSNDLCSNPVVLIPQPYSSACSAPFAATLVGATTNDCQTSGDIWFSFVAGTASQTILLENITAVVGAKNGIFATVYSDCNGSFITSGGAFVFNNTTSSSIALNDMTPGTTYLLKIHTMVGTSSSFNICMVNRPTNDDCATAQVLTVQTNATCSTPTGGTTTYATLSSSTPACFGTADDDVWFSFVATACAHIITVTPFGVGSIENPVVELKDGTCSGISLYCVNAMGAYGTEVINANNLVPGRTYFVRVWDFGSFGANFVGRGIFTICVTTPSIMNFISSTTAQNSNNLASGATADILQLGVVVNGTGCPLSITQIRVNTNGTTNNADINYAKIYYTGTNSFFNINTATLFGTAILRPLSGTLTFNGAQTLTGGNTGNLTNYFWLVYDVSACANLNNVFDGQIVDFTFSGGSPVVPTITSPSGTRTITSAATIFTSINDGNWSSPNTWGGCLPPANTTVVNINSNVVLDGDYSYNSAGINVLSSGVLTINSNTLSLGATGGGDRKLGVNGTLQVNGGTINVNGQFFLSNSGIFQMTGGNINIDGNSGVSSTSLAYNVPEFYIYDNTASATVNCSGGTITIVDPHFNAAAFFYVPTCVEIQMSSSNPNITSFAGSTIRFGNGISTQTSSVPFYYSNYSSTKNVPLGNVIVNGGSTTNRYVSPYLGGDIYGTLTVNAGSELTNGNGSIGVCGNIINNGIITTANYQFFLGGSRLGGIPACGTPQSISGSGIWRDNETSPTSSIFSLVMNNPAGTTLNVPLSTRDLTLNFGNIMTSTVNYLAVGSGILPTGTLATGIITNEGSNSSKIIGPIKRPVVNGSSLNFPVGDGNTRRRVLVSFSTLPTTFGVLTAQYKPGLPTTTGLPITDGGLLINGISQTGYWEVTKDNNLTGGQYIIYADATGFTTSNGNPITDLSSIRLIKRPSGGNWVSTDGVPSIGWALNETNRANCTSFSEFAIGGNLGFVLSVEFINFSAKGSEGGKTLITWQTASETNVKNFDIEKSIDGTNFSKIKEAKANNTPSVYQAFDDNFTESAYYRLKIIDLDGKTDYSKIVFVDKNMQRGIKISKNTEGPLSIETDDIIEQVTLTNAVGQVLKTDKSNLLLMDNIPMGIYIISVKTDKGFLSQKVLRH
jgi:hypothetical protein